MVQRFVPRIELHDGVGTSLKFMRLTTMAAMELFSRPNIHIIDYYLSAWYLSKIFFLRENRKH